MDNCGITEEDSFDDETLFIDSINLFHDGAGKPVKRNKTVMNGNRDSKYQALNIIAQGGDILQHTHTWEE